MCLPEMSAVIPGKHPVRRKNMAVMHYLLTLLPFFFVDKVAYQHIQCLVTAGNIPQSIQNLFVSLFLYPVVGVNYLEIQTRCVFNPRIHGRTVTAVFLMNCFNDIGILCRIFICNFRGIILGGAIVHNQYFHIFSSL